jgi:hypothetical protein
MAGASLTVCRRFESVNFFSFLLTLRVLFYSCVVSIILWNFFISALILSALLCKSVAAFIAISNVSYS